MDENNYMYYPYGINEIGDQRQFGVGFGGIGFGGFHPGFGFFHPFFPFFPFFGFPGFHHFHHHFMHHRWE